MIDLKDLEQIIAQRAGETAQKSYTKSLLEKGQNHCAKKFGEEAVELIIALSSQSHQETIGEAADVLYHLLVALKAKEITLDAVYAELNRRTAQSGHEEKAGR